MRLPEWWLDARGWSVRGDIVLGAMLLNALAAAVWASAALFGMSRIWAGTLAIGIVTAATFVLGRTSWKDWSAWMQAWEAGRVVETNVPNLRVRSRAEARIANWLHARGIEFVYESELAGYRPDFYLLKHRVVIEYWGSNDAAYAARRAEKVAAYQRQGYGIISLEGWQGLEETLQNKLYRWDKTVYREPAEVVQ